MRHLNLTIMANRILRVVVPSIDAPYVNNISDTVDKPGIVWEILRDAAKTLNWTFEIVSMVHEGWGKKGPWGKWNGAFGMLAEEGEEGADILAGATIINSERYDIFGFTVPIDFQESAVLIRVTDRDVAQILFSAFRWKLAFLLLLLLLISFGVFSLFGKKADNFAVRIFSCASVPRAILKPFRLFLLLTKQVRSHPSRHFSSLCILLTFLFAAFLTFANFCALIVFVFSYNKKSPPFETMNEILRAVKSGQWILVLDRKTVGRTELLENIFDDPELWKLLEDGNRIKFVNGLINGARFVQRYLGNAMLIGPNGRLRLLATIMCDVMVLPKTVLPAYVGIALRDKSPYKDFLDRRIYSFWAGGRIQRLSNDFIIDALLQNRVNQSTCAKSYNKRLTKGILGLTHLANILFLFAFGLFASFAVFAVELAIKFAAIYNEAKGK